MMISNRSDGPFRLSKSGSATYPLRSLPFLLAAAVFFSPVMADEAAPVGGGQQVYEKNCAKCHSSAMGGFFTGAPKFGTEVWRARLDAAGSVDALVKSTAAGKGKMPPQAGAATGLSEADVKAAVEYILKYNVH
jgi:cytochrome c5